MDTNPHANSEEAGDEEAFRALESRLGRLYARQRLGIERDHEAQVFGYGLNLFHPENWYAMHAILSAALKLSGLYWRGRRNAEDVQVRRNVFMSSVLPPSFDGFTLLQLSDLHADTSKPAMNCLTGLLSDLRYDLCVWTGDYRGPTTGDFLPSIDVLERIRESIKGDVFAVLGNHDTILMVPHLEKMGVRMLINEAAEISCGTGRIHIAGIDDAHFFRVDNIEKAAAHLSPDEFTILLSHTPEIYKQAAHAGFDVMLSGHTHGGQICLPGGIPLTLDSVLPRHMGAGAWKYRDMLGYTSTGAGTSIVPVRLNCPPEITLHELRRSKTQ